MTCARSVSFGDYSAGKIAATFATYSGFTFSPLISFATGSVDTPARLATGRNDHSRDLIVAKRAETCADGCGVEG